MSYYSGFQLKLTRLLVGAALFWERLVPIWFPAILFPALYIVAALFGLWASIGDPWRLLGLLSTAALTLYYTLRGVRYFQRPNTDQVERRLEENARLVGRPLEILNDEPPDVASIQLRDSTALTLWREQQARARKMLARLRPQKPRAELARQDVFGLRAAAFLLVFAGFIIAGPRAGERLDEAFAPRFLSHNTLPLRIEAWITGPEYALQAPRFLARSQNEPVEVLSGSRFHVKVSGARKKPVLKVRAGRKKRKVKAQKTGPQNYDLSTVLDKNSLLSLGRASTSLWKIVVKEDLPPQIRFSTVPHGDASDALVFAYNASDDVGITKIRLKMSRVEGPPEDKWVDLDLPAKNARMLDEKMQMDFTRHPWAGLPVSLSLLVFDGLEQEGQTKPVTMTLPEKLFVNPMAKAIAEQRTLLVRTTEPYAPFPERPVQYAEDIRAKPLFAQDKPEERLLRAPKQIQRSAALMRASLRAPELYFEDPLVYVGLRYAAENLRLARAPADFKGLDDELWALALWAEGGALADARAALKAAERAFRRALARGAPADELTRLMHNYERAVKRYLEALAEEALRNGQVAENSGGGAPAMNADTLQEMLDALKALSETGARGDARKLLQALSELLQKMQMQLTAGSGPGNDAASKAMRKALEELGDITAEQRELLDEMFRKQQEANRNGGSPQGDQSSDEAQSGAGLAGEQDSLAERLRGLADGQRQDGRENAAGILGEGADEMGDAADALREGDTVGGLDAGKDALSALRDGSESLASDLFDHIAKQNGQNAGDDRDPFGRPTRGGGSQSADGTSVPDVINAERARKILQLLRDRAAQKGRSDKELEYLDRLLKQF